MLDYYYCDGPQSSARFYTVRCGHRPFQPVLLREVVIVDVSSSGVPDSKSSPDNKHRLLKR
jgi:hypothetical protein